MTYEVLLLRKAQKSLGDLHGADYERVKTVLTGLADEPRPSGYLKLTAHEGWRLRVGNYRLIYEIDDKTQQVTVLDIGDRKDIYR